MSDFRDDGFEKALSVAGRRHDLVAVRLGDARETELPAMGLVELQDPENGKRVLVNTSSRAFRTAFKRETERRAGTLDRALKRSKVDTIDVRTGEPYVKPLMRFFRERARRQR